MNYSGKCGGRNFSSFHRFGSGEGFDTDSGFFLSDSDPVSSIGSHPRSDFISMFGFSSDFFRGSDPDPYHIKPQPGS